MALDQRRWKFDKVEVVPPSFVVRANEIRDFQLVQTAPQFSQLLEQWLGDPTRRLLVLELEKAFTIKHSAPMLGRDQGRHDDASIVASLKSAFVARKFFVLRLSGKLSKVLATGEGQRWQFDGNQIVESDFPIRISEVADHFDVKDKALLSESLTAWLKDSKDRGEVLQIHNAIAPDQEISLTESAEPALDKKIVDEVVAAWSDKKLFFLRHRIEGGAGDETEAGGIGAAKEPAPPPPRAPAVPPPTVSPSVTPKTNVVVVAKPHTKPARVSVVLKTDKPFDGTGEFTAAPADTISFFTAAHGGTAIKFDKKQNVFSGPALTSGVTLFAEGAKASGGMDDVALTLTLAGGSKTIIRNPGKATMTSVDATLQICQMRTAAGADPPVLSETDKLKPGRPIHVQTKDNKRNRALLKASVKPATFTGKLVLSIEAAHAGKVKLFPNEKVTVGEAAVVAPVEIPAPGKNFFVEGAVTSSTVRDLKMVLGIKDLEKDADHLFVTVIEAKLGILKSREKGAKDGVELSDDDKVKLGRAIHLQNAAKTKHRATLVVHQVKPADFVGKLELAPLDVTKVQVFPNEKPTAGEAALGAKIELDHNAAFPAAGMKRFAEGAKVSTALVDTACTLGVKDVENECDRVSITVYQIEKVDVKLRATPCLRDASRADIMPAKTITADSQTFDATAITVVRECGDLKMVATAKPAAIVLEWDRTRAADDSASLKAKTLPTSAADGSDKKRKVTADATGSFHVFAFVDSNGNKTRNDEEDGITVNVNMVEMEVVAGAANNKILSAPTYTSAGTVTVRSGPQPPAGVWTQLSWGDAGFAGQAIAMKVKVKLTGGGGDERRGVPSVTLGYIQDTPNDTFKGTYADGRTEVERIFTAPTGTVLPPPPPPPPPPAPPVILAFPVRDHHGIANFNGVNCFINTSSDQNAADIINLPGGGQTRVVRFVDSPAAACDATHPVAGSALAAISGSNFFTDFLVGFSKDFDENFTVLATASWSTTYGTYTPAVGGGAWTPAGAAVSPSDTKMNVNKPAVKGESVAGFERCPPGYTDNYAMDAR